MNELHEEDTDKPGWHTKALCTCGHETVSRAEMWKHQADALRALIVEDHGAP